MHLDPFDVLGICPTSSLTDIKRAYKFMLKQTHPDKMGDARYFMLVHEAYESLKRQFVHKSFDAPKSLPSYNDDAIPQPRKMKNYSNAKFNDFFEKHRIRGDDPYATNGYGRHMAESLNYREDVNVAARSSTYIPTEQLAVYCEPEYLPISKKIESCYHLGQTHVSDFSGGGGSDIMKAFTHREGTIPDTSTKYTSVDDCIKQRSKQRMELTAEDLRRHKKLEKQRLRLEQYRINAMHRSDRQVEHDFATLHRRLK